MSRDLDKEALELQARVAELAKRASDSMEGLSQVNEELGGLELGYAELRAEPVQREAAIVRAVAEKVIGPEWEWQVLSSIDGAARCVVTRYVGRTPDQPQQLDMYDLMMRGQLQ